MTDQNGGFDDAENIGLCNRGFNCKRRRSTYSDTYQRSFWKTDYEWNVYFPVSSVFETDETGQRMESGH